MLTQNFILAGEAVFTIEIPAERQKDFGGKTHYTYRVDKVEANAQWAESYFVKLLTGPDNTKDFSYLGKLDTFTGQARPTAKSFLAAEATPFRLLNRVLARVWANDNAAFEQFGFRLHHEGACGRCGKRLTRPGPIERGIGDDCAVIMGLVPAPKKREGNRAAARRRKEERELELVGVNDGEASRDQHERMLDR